jgi:hypothetical protein
MICATGARPTGGSRLLPEQAPDGLRGRFQAAHDITQRAQVARGHSGNQRAPFGDLFNRDTVGLP